MSAVADYARPSRTGTLLIRQIYVEGRRPAFRRFVAETGGLSFCLVIEATTASVRSLADG